MSILFDSSIKNCPSKKIRKLPFFDEKAHFSKTACDYVT